MGCKGGQTDVRLADRRAEVQTVFEQPPLFTMQMIVSPRQELCAQVAATCIWPT